MTSIIEISIIAMVASIITLMLKKDRPEIAYIISLTAGIIILFAIFPSAKEAITIIRGLSELSGINTGHIGVILKSCIIAMITCVSANSCRDAGNSSLASKVEIAGRIAIIIMASPTIGILFNVILSVIK